jgi:hypothetical protein
VPSSQNRCRPPALSAHTAAGAKAKTSGRTNSVIIASALQPRHRRPRSEPRRPGTLAERTPSKYFGDKGC